MADESFSPLSSEAQEHYASGYEARRLQSPGGGQVELARTKELVMRYIPPPPAVIFDIGGGPGIYALWLAKQGYEVHLVDAHPLHVELARQASQAQPDAPLTEIALGDARSLNYSDASADAALMLGPLYHLIERADRLKALREAHRILKPSGILLAVGISRFASVLDGLHLGLFDDPTFVQIVHQDLTDGQHRNPTNHPKYFTTAFFHAPEELASEVQESGFLYETTLPIEGPLWHSPYVAANFQDPQRRELLLGLVRRLEQEPSLLGVSAHLMAVARKQAVSPATGTDHAS
ncbi:MAG: class I SAM-dependent methyltransferase [Ktedonobacteraceae bacterium]|nr:class I SAM-dependent methyltransferase [Ktedonobacteraceae bacterium]